MSKIVYSKRQLICLGISVFFLAIGIALILAGIFMLVKVLPDTIEKQVKKNKVIGKLDDGSLNSITRSWTAPSYITYMQYWLYNYTNPLEIQHRQAKPDLIERGPYSYREVQHNEIQGWSEDLSQLYYRPRSVFTFDKSTSCDGCDPSDMFLVPDILFFKIWELLTDMNELQTFLCEMMPTACGIPFDLIGGYIDNYTEYITLAMKAMDAGPFVYTSVEDLVFRGYDDPIFTKLAAFLLGAVQAINPDPTAAPLSIDFPKVALNSKNNTFGPQYTMLTGKDAVEDVGLIIALFDSDNSTSNSDGNLLSDSWWDDNNGDNCPAEASILARRINGTLGDFFKPFIEKTDRLYTYVADICRSVYFEYKEETKVKGIDGYRFVIPKEVFDYSQYENCGFCHQLNHDVYSMKKDEFCLPNGMLDISRCTALNPPVIISLPHFLYSSKEALDLLPRLLPEPEVHQTAIDVEPTMGIVLRANKRLQINLLVNKINVTKTYNVQMTGAYPILWVNESFLIDEESVKDLNSQLIGPRRTARIICWVIGIGLGIACVLFSVVIFIAVVCGAKRERSSAKPVEIQRPINVPSIEEEKTTVRRRVFGSSGAD